MYTAASEAGIAIEAVAALARDKSLNVAQEYARRADQLRTFGERVPQADPCTAAKSTLFDHLVGLGQQCR